MIIKNNGQIQTSFKIKLGKKYKWKSYLKILKFTLFLSWV